MEAKKCGPWGEPADSRRVLLGRRTRYGLVVVFSTIQAAAEVSVSGRFAFGWVPYDSPTRSLGRDTSHTASPPSARSGGRTPTSWTTCSLVLRVEIAGTAHEAASGSGLVLSRFASVAGSEPPSFHNVSGGSSAARAAYAWTYGRAPRVRVTGNLQRTRNSHRVQRGLVSGPQRAQVPSDGERPDGSRLSVRVREQASAAFACGYRRPSGTRPAQSRIASRSRRGTSFTTWRWWSRSTRTSGLSKRRARPGR